MTSRYQDPCTRALRDLCGQIVRREIVGPDAVAVSVNAILEGHDRMDLVERDGDHTHLAVNYLQGIDYTHAEAEGKVREIGCPSTVIDLVVNSGKYEDPRRRRFWVQEALSGVLKSIYRATHRPMINKRTKKVTWLPIKGAVWVSEHQLRRAAEARKREQASETQTATVHADAPEHIGDALTGWTEER